MDACRCGVRVLPVPAQHQVLQEQETTVRAPAALARPTESVMLTALILVCSMAVTPDLSECTHANAVDVMRLPIESSNPATCFMHGQSFLADTSIGRDIGPNERVKVVCSPSHRQATIAAKPIAVR
jgi:hypothetical protein